MLANACEDKVTLTNYASLFPTDFSFHYQPYLGTTSVLPFDHVLLLGFKLYYSFTLHHLYSPWMRAHLPPQNI